MSSPSGYGMFDNYVKWALTVTEPMTMKYSKRKDFVTVKIPLDFQTKIMCKDCIADGPHITADHIFRITLTTARDGAHELRMFNDKNNNCIIPPETDGFESLKSRVSAEGNQSHFYGKVDEDDRTVLYINIATFP